MSEREAIGGAGGDRRESPRVALRFKVRHEAPGGSFEERDGDVSVGGVSFTEPRAPLGTRVEVRLLLPGEAEEVHAVGAIAQVTRAAGGAFRAHVRFEGLSLEGERAIARFLDGMVAG